jgi:hypothetical protein
VGYWEMSRILINGLIDEGIIKDTGRMGPYKIEILFLEFI